ncbi:MAG: hypothetical protein ACKOEZ_12940 [Spartobacteria bacterium]
MYRAFHILDDPAGFDSRHRRALRNRNQLASSPFVSRRRKIVEEFGKILRASIAKGLLAGKAIALPALLVQGLILLIVWGYYFSPQARQMIEVAVNLKKEGGFFFSFVCTAGIAVFAECLRAVFGDAESRRRLLPNCAYGFLVFGVLGILTDTFYILQKSLWSGLPSTLQVVAKVATDQFVWTVFFANPYQTLLYVFKDCGFNFESFAQRLNPFRIFYVKEMLAVLLTNWVFWNPTSAILYSLPLDLQFVISRLAIVIWILLLTTMTKK